MIHTLPSPKTTKSGKRLGRGMGSGKGGHTSGRGGKGATARSGYKAPRRNFEGGQNPISRRLPKYKGFTRGFVKSAEVNAPVKLSILAGFATEAKLTEITLESLVQLGLLKLKAHKVVMPKVLFDKDIEVALNLKGIKTSKSAKSAIEKAGGKVEA
jgi:large subunit ribosomal protein L15